MSIMDQVKLNLREWYSLAADRTGEMAKISVRMYDKYGISREIERQLSELGSYVYQEHALGHMDFAADETFQAAIERIQVLERDLSAKVDEIEVIRQQRQQKAAAQEAAEAEAAAQEAAAAAARQADTGADDEPVEAEVFEPHPHHPPHSAATRPIADQAHSFEPPVVEDEGQESDDPTRPVRPPEDRP